ncbi:MAG: hypothetical protein QOF16_1435 [Actinomycetota bacterium]|jgi:hypothetical protein|nr:hypothetical protein [Actinomycetota bacterium]
MRKVSIATVLATLVGVALVPLAGQTQAKTASTATFQRAISPVATDDTTYQALGRVFPDPQACNKGQPEHSPYAKGTVCATDFMQYSEMVNGLDYMQKLFPRFVQFYQLDKDFSCNGKPVTIQTKPCKNFKSAGLPVTVNAQNGQGVTRDRQHLYMVRITDEKVSNKHKKYFVFPMSIHGIERAGVEGGTRAAEDLATWGACEAKVAPSVVNCNAEAPIPHPLLEATPKKSITAGKALRKSVIYFIYPNADGWVRGDRTTGTQFYQRYNGNGVDENRDWPEIGYTFRPYTPWSEPETHSFGKVLRAVGPHKKNGDPQWTGGIDLHGQLTANAFSYTLLGGSQRDYGENQRILQTVKGAWRDASKRLSYSPLIKPNSADASDPRFYGVQWGTVWDTLEYTVTGALGDWIDSPVGLNADGIDNEMSLSHVSNCGTGSCFDPDVEQLHIDGNKSLVYSMIDFSLKPEKTTFFTKGKVGYVYNKGVVSSPTKHFVAPPKFAKLPTQKDIHGVQLTPANNYIQQFHVKGPKQGVYNGGINVTITCANAQGVGPCALNEARLERRKPSEPTAQGEKWETVNSYFNQSSLYVQAGQSLVANLPTPGLYRVRIVNDNNQTSGVFNADIDFTKEKGWPDPGQVGYRATNMKFWNQLRPFAKPGVHKLSPKKMLRSRKWMRHYDTIAVTNKVYKRLGPILRKWVARFNGNLVLTDRALGELKAMKIIKGGIGVTKKYAGYINFATSKRAVTYKDPLAKNVNQGGAAEGTSGSEVHRHQTYEPVPIGYAIQDAQGNDAFTSPIYYVDGSVFKKAKGRPRAVGTTGGLTNVSLGEVRYKGGRIRFLGAVLPMPTEKFDHPFGLSSYAPTYTGYQLLKNLLSWRARH